MTTYNTYKMSKVIEQKMKADLVELGHSPSSSYFDMDREEIDDFINLLPIVTKDIEGNKKRFSISVIRKLLSILIRSKKKDGKLLSLDSQKDLKFQIVGMNTIRQFERLANVKFDESQFSTLREFQQYIRELMLTKDNKKLMTTL